MGKASRIAHRAAGRRETRGPREPLITERVKAWAETNYPPVIIHGDIAARAQSLAEALAVPELSGRRNCFGAAYGAAQLLNQVRFHDPIMVVHGYPRGTAGETRCLRYAHAWVEAEAFAGQGEAFVMDLAAGRAKIMNRRAYYALGQITEDVVRRYPMDKIESLYTLFDHYGPWWNCPLEGT